MLVCSLLQSARCCRRSSDDAVSAKHFVSLVPHRCFLEKYLGATEFKQYARRALLNRDQMPAKPAISQRRLQVATLYHAVILNPV